MTFLLKQIFEFFKLLNSETGTNQIASGIAMGFILGMAPVFSLQTILVFSLSLFFRVQLGAMFLAVFFFKFAAWLLDPIFHRVGTSILLMDSLTGLWTKLYNMPIIPFTRFNNSVVMGAGATSILLAPLVFMASRLLVLKYREKIVERFKETMFFKLLKTTSLFKWYEKYDSLYGN
jgi:uncharacterized protein (TIGR03546 family)